MPALLLALVLALLVPALVAAGCGGDGSGDGTTTTSALTADRWRAQVDAICADINSRLDALGQPASEADAGGYFERGLPIAREGLDRLKAITPPAELRSLHDRSVALQEKQLGMLQQLVDRLAAGESPSAVLGELGPDLDGTEQELDAVAQAAGLTVCGRDEGPPTGASGGTASDRYADDLRTVNAVMTTFDSTLESLTGPEVLEAAMPRLREEVDEFDEAIASMADYTLDDPAFERQRAIVVENGPDASAAMRRFLAGVRDAFDEGMPARLTVLVPEVEAALKEFVEAADR